MTVTLGEMTLRVRMERGSGMRAVLILEGSREALLRVAADLASEITAVVQVNVVRINHPLNARVLEAGVRSASATAAIVATDFSHYGDADWRHIDLLRSRFDRAEPLLLLMRPAEAGGLHTFAPNFSSWIGTGVFDFEPESPVQGMADRESRLAALQQRYEVTSDEMLRRVQGGQLPRDPEISEWLILIGRPDLIAR